jgi:hypothetical protein
MLNSTQALPCPTPLNVWKLQIFATDDHAVFAIDDHDVFTFVINVLYSLNQSFGNIFLLQCLPNFLPAYIIIYLFICSLTPFQ